jgi:hypothetical protein
MPRGAVRGGGARTDVTDAVDGVDDFLVELREVHERRAATEDALAAHGAEAVAHRLAPAALLLAEVVGERVLPGRFRPQDCLASTGRRDIGKISVNMDRLQDRNGRLTIRRKRTSEYSSPTLF